ncbi:uncharacterized protein LOC143218090 isoform X1 [Lasioglossum baleicum]|uniref:uncharacterized protein LOC143218090 isoform X1 n=1 Tax=Lasioglossum baleicum TaxID=434251 RepID=UPI003FCCFB8B
MLNTFIFFDLETTGLMANNCMPKITEVSLIAVSRNAISDTTKTLPRVLSKLVLPINPLKHIPQKVETITGLSNQDLENVKPFTCDTHDMIANFIKRFVPPVCFVAYNGNQYDYPIFLKELEHIKKDVSEDILCIDMLCLIQNFFSNRGSQNKKSVIQANTCMSYNNEDMGIMLDDGWNEILSAVVDNTKYDCSNNHDETLIHLNEGNENCSNDISIFDSPRTSYYEKMQRTNEKTPHGQVIKHSGIKLNIKDHKTKRRLGFVNNKPNNFKLTTVYKHICGTDPINAHNAETDCLFMIECAVQIERFFLEWADLNAVPMISYKK